jgi:mRNA-degrading endonuclease RelE of RelBE toxin-antitoxin system
MLRRPVWSDAARADIRALDRVTAMRLFEALFRYLASGEGDVKRLQGRDNEFRLRAGDYRICFTPEGDLLHIHWVRHRSEAYK